MSYDFRNPSGLALRHPQVVVCFFFARFRFGPRGDFTSSACEALCWYSMIFRLCNVCFGSLDGRGSNSLGPAHSHINLLYRQTAVAFTSFPLSLVGAVLRLSSSMLVTHFKRAFLLEKEDEEDSEGKTGGGVK